MAYVIIVRWAPLKNMGIVEEVYINIYSSCLCPTKNVCDNKSMWDFKWLLFVNKAVTSLKEFCELGELTKAINFVLRSSASTAFVCTSCKLKL